MSLSLDPGDQIDISVTHQVIIDREQSWIKVGVSVQVRDDETAEQAVERANEVVQQKIFYVIDSTVAAVAKYKEKK